MPTLCGMYKAQKASNKASQSGRRISMNCGIGLPQRFVIRHRVAVAGEYQTAGAAAETGEQVELARADLLDIATEAQLTRHVASKSITPSVSCTQPHLDQSNRAVIDLLATWLGEAHHRAICATE